MTDLCRCLVINQSVGQITDGLDEKSADHQIHPEVNMNAQWPKRICCMLYIFNCKLNILTFTVVVFGVHETVLTVLQLSPTSNFKVGFLLFVLSSRSQLSALIKDTQHTWEYFASKIYNALGAHTLCLYASYSCRSIWQYAFRSNPMTRKLLSPTQTLLFIQDMALQISSPLSSPPPLSSISPSVSRSDPRAFCMAIHMVLWAILCVCVCMMSVNLFGSECHFKSLHVTYTHGYTHWPDAKCPTYTTAQLAHWRMADWPLYRLANCFCLQGIFL